MAIIASIQHGDVVRHRDGKTYRVSEVTRDQHGDPSHVLIAREGEGIAFDGPPEVARTQGFAFGSETFVSNGRPISHYDIPEMIDLSERAYVGSADELGQRTHVAGFAISAGNEVVRLQHSLVAEQARARGVQYELDTFRVEVRDAIIAAAKEHDLCKEGTNAVLENLGLPVWEKSWTVTVTRDSDDETILTVTGIEAKTGSDAEEEVRSNFSVSATVKRVQFDYSYDGEGESDFDETDWDDDDFDEEDTDYADTHKDGLSFSAEEE